MQQSLCAFFNRVLSGNELESLSLWQSNIYYKQPSLYTHRDVTLGTRPTQLLSNELSVYIMASISNHTCAASVVWDLGLVAFVLDEICTGQDISLAD